jgi:hypothetical protein
VRICDKKWLYGTLKSFALAGKHVRCASALGELKSGFRGRASESELELKVNESGRSP